MLDDMPHECAILLLSLLLWVVFTYVHVYMCMMLIRCVFVGVAVMQVILTQKLDERAEKLASHQMTKETAYAG